MTGIRVLVRADAGPEIGSGHLLRSLAVADALRARGAQVSFVTTASASPFLRRLDRAGHEVVVLPGDHAADSSAKPWPEAVQRADLLAVRAAGPARFDVVIVDHYGLDELWEQGAREFAETIVVLDDLADRRHEADVLVDHNWYGPATAERYRGLVPATCLLLLGPKYALLDPYYAVARRRTERRTGRPRRLLVSYGGTDPTGETVKVLRALAAPLFADLAVDVVLGGSRPREALIRSLVEQRAGTTVHVDLPTLADLLAGADLALGAGGTATWERICLGVPALVTTTRENQSGVTIALAAAGMTAWAGLAADTDIERYRDLVTACLDDPPGPLAPLVDGYGAERVAEAVVPTTGLRHLSARRAVRLDAPMFLGADRGAVGQLPRLLDGPQVWVDEERRFRRDLERADTDVFVICIRDVPVGNARVEHRREEASMCLSLDDAVARGPLAVRVPDALAGLGGS